MKVVEGEADLQGRVRCRRRPRPALGVRRPDVVHREVHPAMPGTSKCNCSATGSAMSSISANATARSSAATRSVVEEAPAPGIADTLRQAIRDGAVELARMIDYRSAGTVEFIYDEDAKAFYFLEMNTRIQVEHPVSEAISGIDSGAGAVSDRRGQALRTTQSDIVFRGHAIECRINAEIPEEGFRPNAGVIEQWKPPTGPNLRVDTHCYSGYRVPIFTIPCLPN